LLECELEQLDSDLELMSQFGGAFRGDCGLFLLGLNN